MGDEGQGQPKATRLGRMKYPPDLNGGAQEAKTIRQSLSHNILQIIGTAYQDDRALTEDENEWVMNALLWINHHPGQAGAESRADGDALVWEYRQAGFS